MLRIQILDHDHRLGRESRLLQREGVVREARHVRSLREVRRQSDIPHLDAILVKVHDEERSERFDGVDRPAKATIDPLPVR